MLSSRKEAILKLVIGEHVESAQPVGSETIVHKYALALSPATVRNEMAELEELGYITHPHPSAGRVPSARGYRYYVAHLMAEQRLPRDEQYRILHQFHQVETDLEEWARLAAVLLARLVQNAVVVTLPKVPASRLKQLQLLSVHERRAWLVVVLQEGTLRQQLLHFDAPVNQADLNATATRLNATLSGLTAAEIGQRWPAPADPPSLEGDVVGALARLMQGMDQQGYHDVCLEGLHALLSQPEFDQPARRRRALEMLGERHSLLGILPWWADASQVSVSIGEENAQEALHDFSLIAAPYGIPGEVGGVVAVLGPTRLHYERAVAAARYVAAVLSELLRELHG